MNFEILQSGIAVPQQPKQSPPKRIYPPLEIQNEERRKQTAYALSQLWHALDLSGRNRLLDTTEERIAKDVHRKLFDLIGDTLLGSDCPEHEILT